MFNGEWENDEANGKGVYYHASGATYDGTLIMFLAIAKLICFYF